MKIDAPAVRLAPRPTAPFVLGVSLSLVALVLTVGAGAMQRAARGAPEPAPPVPAALAAQRAHPSPLDSTLHLLHGAFLAGEPGLTRAADARLDDAAFALQEGDGWTVEWTERDALLADARAAHLRKRLELWGHADRVRIVARKGVPGVRARAR
jgi:hypothetical protein